MVLWSGMGLGPPFEYPAMRRPNQAETGASSMRDMGKVVGSLRARYAGRMDFAKASSIVKDLLPKV